MKIREALKLAIEELKKADILTYGNDAIILVKTAIEKDDIFVLTNPNYELSEPQKKRFLKLLTKRKERYPIAYITRQKEFYGFPFYVDERVLIPRPETETLIDTVLKLVNRQENQTIVDIGTGSGCIAITLSKLLKAKIFASDISKDALNVAKLNARKLKADVEFIQADKVEWLKKADIVVSNPPYVSKEEYNDLSEDVKYEPKLALIAEEHGTAFIKSLIEGVKNKTKYLVLEFGYNQSEFIKKQPNLIEIVKDLTKIERVAVFRFN